MLLFILAESCNTNILYNCLAFVFSCLLAVGPSRGHGNQGRNISTHATMTITRVAVSPIRVRFRTSCKTDGFASGKACSKAQIVIATVGFSPISLWQDQSSQGFRAARAYRVEVLSPKP